MSTPEKMQDVTVNLAHTRDLRHRADHGDCAGRLGGDEFTTPQEWTSAADAACYEAKRAGRGTARSWQTPRPAVTDEELELLLTTSG
jgi:hypothetical protein